MKRRVLALQQMARPGATTGLMRSSRTATATTSCVLAKSTAGGTATTPLLRSAAASMAGRWGSRWASSASTTSLRPTGSAAKSASRPPAPAPSAPAPKTKTTSSANRKERKLASVFNYIATHQAAASPASGTTAGTQAAALPAVPPATVDFVQSITDDEREEALGFFTKHVAFLASSVATPNLPAEDQPEFAFVGRSNVGKSSLLNALMTKNLARTSNTPGRTQTINYYQAGEIKLVDLPGYGYAKAPVSIVREWQQFVNTFLSTRKALHGTSVLIDSRRGVMEKDVEVIQMLNAHALPHQVVLTKADKLSRQEIFKVLAETRESLKRYPFCSPIIHITSKDGLGVDELRIALMRAAKSNQSLA